MEVVNRSLEVTVERKGRWGSRRWVVKIVSEGASPSELRNQLGSNAC